jgi:hypothetical protein
LPLTAQVETTIEQPVTSYAEMVNDPALKLSAFERQCGLLWPSLQDYACIAEQVYPDAYADFAAGEISKTKFRAFEREAIRRVKWAVGACLGQLERHYYADLRESGRDFHRSLLAAYQNRRETGRAPEAHIGATPYGELDNETLAERRTWDEYQQAQANPKNYRAVSLRAPLVTAAVLKPLASAERLTTLARHLAAQAELASASV